MKSFVIEHCPDSLGGYNWVAVYNDEVIADIGERTGRPADGEWEALYDWECVAGCLEVQHNGYRDYDHLCEDISYHISTCH